MTRRSAPARAPGPAAGRPSPHNARAGRGGVDPAGVKIGQGSGGGPAEDAGSYSPALLFAFAVCVGHPVTVQTKAGCEYEGIFHTPGLNKHHTHIVLGKARKVKGGADGRQVGQEVERLVIYSGDLCQIKANNVPTPGVGGAAGPQLSPSGGGGHREADAHTEWRRSPDAFGGDRGAKRGNKAGLIGRELQPWATDDSLEAQKGPAGDLDAPVGGLEAGGGGGHWDQFEANERMFGVKTSFDYSLYTSKVNEAESRYTVAQADAIAREIEATAASNVHAAQERNQRIDDSGLDEETLFSAVGQAAADSLDEKPEQPKSPKSPAGSQSISPKTERSSYADAVRGRTGARAASQPVPTPASKPAAQVTSAQQTEANWSRREVNRIHQTLISEKVSPHGSPLVASPLIRDPASFQALNLNPGHTRVDMETRKQFLDFKKQRPAKAMLATETSRLLSKPCPQDSVPPLAGGATCPEPEANHPPPSQPRSLLNFPPPPPQAAGPLPLGQSPHPSPRPASPSPSVPILFGQIEPSLVGFGDPSFCGPQAPPPRSFLSPRIVKQLSFGSDRASTMSGSQVANLNPFARPFHPGQGFTGDAANSHPSPGGSSNSDLPKEEVPTSEESGGASDPVEGAGSDLSKVPCSPEPPLPPDAVEHQMHHQVPVLPHQGAKDPAQPPMAHMGRCSPQMMPPQMVPHQMAPPPPGQHPPPPNRAMPYYSDAARGPAMMPYQQAMWHGNMGPMGQAGPQMMPPFYPGPPMGGQYPMQYFPAPMMPPHGAFQPYSPVRPMQGPAMQPQPPTRTWRGNGNGRSRGSRGSRKTGGGRSYAAPRRGPVPG